MTKDVTKNPFWSPVLATSETANPYKKWVRSLKVSKSAKTLPKLCQNQDMEIEISEFILKDRNESLDKDWYVEFYITTNGVKQRIRIHGDINRFHTLSERKNHAKRVIQALNLSLLPAKSDLIKEANINKLANGTRDLTIPSSNEPIYSLKSLFDTLEKGKTIYRNRSYSTYKHTLVCFARFYEQNPIGLTSKLIALYVDYLHKQNFAAKTIHSHIRNLSTLIEKTKEIRPNPCLGFKLSKKTTGKYDIPWTPKELGDLRRYTTDKQHLQIYWGLIYYCAIRPNEMSFLQPKNFDFHSKLITIEDFASKVKKTHAISIPKQFLSNLEDYISSIEEGYYIFSKNLKPGLHKYTGNKLSEYWKNQVKSKTKLQKNAYQLKHTAAIKMVYANIPIDKIRSHFRHKDQAMTQEYLKSLESYVYNDIADTFPED